MASGAKSLGLGEGPRSWASQGNWQSSKAAASLLEENECERPPYCSLFTQVVWSSYFDIFLSHL